MAAMINRLSQNQHLSHTFAAVQRNMNAKEQEK